MQSIGSLVVDVAGTELSQQDKEILAHPAVGGLILFSRNYQSRAQIQHLISQARASRRAPLVVMVDQEGGRVQRFKSEFTLLPPVADYGKEYLANPNSALEQAKQHGLVMAQELVSVGVDISLAPVVDLNRGLNDVIGDRAFHGEAAIVIALANAFIQGMQKAGMAACIKHFPGHGAVHSDSHIAQPIDSRPLAAILETDLLPFIALIKANVPAIMAAHITFPSIDNTPAGFSPIWLQKILRQQLGFQGTIFTDDLNMAGAAISMNYADRVQVAREAGCDFALLCNNREGVIQAIDGLAIDEQQVLASKWQMLLQHPSHQLIS
jgi:beta-N-acetylhexosaminidase